jgi:hypothetical protein
MLQEALSASQVNWGAGNSQSSVSYVVLIAEPHWAEHLEQVLQAAPSVTVTTTRANSIIFGCTADWKAIDGATRTLRTALPKDYISEMAIIQLIIIPRATSIADYTEGINAPTGQQSSTALLEIRSAAPVATRLKTITGYQYCKTKFKFT